MKLEEIDLLRIKNIDLEIERLIMSVEMAKLMAKNANSDISGMNQKRVNIYNELKNKYEIEDFKYDRENGEIMLLQPKS